MTGYRMRCLETCLHAAYDLVGKIRHIIIYNAAIMLGTTSIEPIQCYWKQEKEFIHCQRPCYIKSEGAGSIRDTVAKRRRTVDFNKGREPREPSLPTKKHEELRLAEFSRKGRKREGLWVLQN